MSPLFGAAAVFDLRQALLQLNAIHTALPKPLSNSATANHCAADFGCCSRSAPAKVTAVSSLRWLCVSYVRLCQSNVLLRISRPFRLDSS